MAIIWLLALCRIVYTRALPSTNPFGELSTWMGIKCCEVGITAEKAARQRSSEAAVLAAQQALTAKATLGKVGAGAAQLGHALENSAAAQAAAAAALGHRVKQRTGLSKLGERISKTPGMGKLASGASKVVAVAAKGTVKATKATRDATKVTAKTTAVGIKVTADVSAKVTASTARISAKNASDAAEVTAYTIDAARKKLNRAVQMVEIFYDPIAELAGVGGLVRRVGRRTAVSILTVLFNILGIIPFVLNLLLKMLPLLFVAITFGTWFGTLKASEGTGMLNHYVTSDMKIRALLEDRGIVAQLRAHPELHSALFGLASSPVILEQTVSPELPTLLRVSATMFNASSHHASLSRAVARDPALRVQIARVNEVVSNGLLQLSGVSDQVCARIRTGGGLIATVRETCTTALMMTDTIQPLLSSVQELRTTLLDLTAAFQPLEQQATATLSTLTTSIDQINSVAATAGSDVAAFGVTITNPLNNAATEVQTLATQLNDQVAQTQAVLDAIPPIPTISELMARPEFAQLVSGLGLVRTTCTDYVGRLEEFAFGTVNRTGVCTILEMVQECDTEGATVNTCMAPLVDQVLAEMSRSVPPVNQEYRNVRTLVVSVHDTLQQLLWQMVENWPFDAAVQARMLSGDEGIDEETRFRFSSIEWLVTAGSNTRRTWGELTSAIHQNLVDCTRMPVVECTRAPDNPCANERARSSR